MQNVNTLYAVGLSAYVYVFVFDDECEYIQISSFVWLMSVDF